MKIRLHQYIIGIGIILLMTFLFVKTNLIKSDAHNRFSQHLHYLIELDATLNRDILESRYGLLTTYDLLIAETAELKHLQAELKKMPDFLDLVEQNKINTLLSEFNDLQNQKELLVERFKSRNAIINNSLRYFPVATSNLIKNMPADSLDNKDVESLNYLVRDILTYYLLTDTELKPIITNRIELLQQDQKEKRLKVGKTDLDITISHARTILKLKPEVDDLVKQIASLPTANKVEELIRLHDSYFDESLHRANIYRLFLYIFSVLLLAYIAFIIVKLKKATSALNAVNESLEHRVRTRTEELVSSNAELQNSRDYFNQIINAVADPIFVSDRQHRLVLVNDAFCRLSGYTREEITGKSKEELFQPEEARIFLEMDNLVFESGKETSAEVPLIYLLGNRHIQIRKTLYEAQDGEQFIVGVINDITESKKSQEETVQLNVEIENQRQRLDNIIANVQGVVWETPIDADVAQTHLDFVSDYAVTMLGYSVEEWLTTPNFWLSIVHPEDSEKALCEAMEIYNSGQRGKFEFRWITKNGRVIWVESRLEVICNDEGKPTGLRGVTMDITEHKQSEQKNLDLIKSLADIKFALDESSIVVITDQTGKINFVNDRFCAISGYSREELIGQDHRIINSGHHSKEFIRDIWTTIGNGKVWHGEIKNLAKNGSYYWVNTTIVPILNEHGKPYQYVAIRTDITERKKSEEALRENEAKFRDLFDNAPVAYHELDVKGRFTRINHTEELMLGYTNEELIGRHPSEIIVEKGSREVTAAKLAGKMPLQAVERTFIRKDGSLLSVLNEDRMIYDKDGNVTGIRSTLQDITKRKRMEAESQVISEIIQGVSMTSNVKELLKHIHHSISKLLYAENCFVALYNPATEMLDLQLFVDKYNTKPPAFKLGKGMTAYVFRHERPMLLTLENIQQLIKDGEIEMVGTPPAVWLGVPLRTSNGIIGVLVVQHYEDGNAYNQRDLELLTSVGDQIAIAIERKRAEEALKTSEARFQSAFDYAPIGIGLISPNGRWRQVNHSLCEIVGYTKEELLQTSFQHILHPDDVAESRGYLRQLLNNENKTYQIEERYIHKLGHQVLALTSLSIVRDAQDNPLYTIAQIQDITERKFLEEKLQRGQKLESIGQLAAGIAHEINTPTQYVGDNTRFLKDSFQDFTLVLEKNDQLLQACQSNSVTPELLAQMKEAIERADIEYLVEEVPKAIEQALDGVQRISKIVQSMKDFAHPGSTDKKATDLNRAIESTITVASNEWKYVAEVVTNYDEKLPRVPCLIGEFNQVVLNMIINAAHAISDVVGDGSGGKGTIHISTANKGDWAEIRISDTGAGMTEDIRKKIFDPFFTTKEVGKGTGQGLAISHTVIVEKHKGIINVESEVGKGTTFVICLPVNEESDSRV